MLTKKNNDYFFDLFNGFFERSPFFSTLLEEDNFFNNREAVTKTDSAYVLKLAAPGFEEKDLSVSVDNNTITIVGKHEKSDSDKHSFHSSSFTKSYPLTEDSIIDDITAEYKAGVLVVTIPRNQNKRSSVRQIPVNGGAK